MKNFALLALLGTALFGVALAGDCACGPNCPCKVDPLNPGGAAEVKAPGKGHYVKTCGPNGCTLAFVPDDTPEPPLASCAPAVSYHREVPVRRFLHRRR